MAGRGIKLFTDEHVYRDLAAALQARGYDVQSCHEAGRHNQGIKDEPQLEYATSQGRAILSANATDFYRLEYEWKAAQRQHAGIVLYARIYSVSELLWRVQLHLDTIGPQVQHDTLIWVPGV